MIQWPFRRSPGALGICTLALAVSWTMSGCSPLSGIPAADARPNEPCDRAVYPSSAKPSQGEAAASPGNAAPTPAPNAPTLLNVPPPSGEKRIVIYTATLTIVVPEVEAAIKQVEALTVEFGGWVHEIRGDRITIRVPAAKYNDAESRVENLGRVTQRQLEAADVTAEYVDLEARLKNALAVRDRLNALLAKTENVPAALEVEKELNRVGEEIERLQAQLELLKTRVAYSTITITFERVYRAAPTPQLMKLPFDWLHELDPKRLTADY